MASPADRQAEARQDVERIARGFREELEQLGVKLHPDLGNQLRSAVTRLLERDLIRVGARPVPDAPIGGQTTIDDHLSCEHEYEVGNTHCLFCGAEAPPLFPEPRYDH